jgi:hypothetical protein
MLQYCCPFERIISVNDKLAKRQASLKNCDEIDLWKGTDLLYSFWYRKIIFRKPVLFPIWSKSEETKLLVALVGATIFARMKAASEMFIASLLLLKLVMVLAQWECCNNKTHEYTYDTKYTHAEEENNAEIYARNKIYKIWGFQGGDCEEWCLLGLLRLAALVISDVSEELSASFIRVTRIGELGTTLSVTSNRCTLRRNTMFLVHRFLSPWWKRR